MTRVIHVHLVLTLRYLSVELIGKSGDDISQTDLV